MLGSLFKDRVLILTHSLFAMMIFERYNCNNQ